MLPHLEEYGAQPRISNFNQSLDPNLYHDLNSALRPSVARCLDWITHHFNGVTDRFVSAVNGNLRVQLLSMIRTHYLNAGHSKFHGLEIYATQSGLKMTSQMMLWMPFDVDFFLEEIISGNVHYVQTIRCNSTNLAGLGDALCINNSGYEYFHPGYGSALFPTELHFSNWFRRFLPEAEPESFDDANNEEAHALYYSIDPRALHPLLEGDTAIAA